MNKIDARISRWSLGLSLAVKIGLAAWAALVLLAGPQGSAAPLPAIEPAASPASDAVVEARARRHRRAVRKRHSEPQDGDAAHDKGTENKTGETIPPRDQSLAGESTAKNAFDVQAGKAAAKGKPGAPAGKGAGGKSHEPADEPAAAEAPPETWSDDEVIAALAECVRLLGPIEASIDVSKPIRNGQCGTPAPVLLRRVGSVDVSPPALLNCRMVAKLHQWLESTVQPASRDTFKAPVTRMMNASGYVCRHRIGTTIDKISEHAFADALDVTALVLADGRKIDVLSNWGETARDLRAAAQAKAEAERQAKAAAEAAKAEKKPAPGHDGKAQPAGTAGAAKDDKPEAADEAHSEPAKKKEHGSPRHRGRHRGANADEERIPLPSESPVHGKSAVADAGRSNLGGNPHRTTDAAVGTAPPVTVEGAYLRRLHRGACGIFGTVLGPEANEAHRNHFHLDLAPRRHSAFCQ